ncbi:MAG: Asp-tRNA(Asn)/Glu-tRNA(Gln) amidotransferase subunit GatB, partial [Spirochaetes bacterium]|nr:Asp-tRNA(Asn)/Glu-tRNA(Gln) amidotransferase subunit GatB [Spirochaetota bacterium]
IVSEPEMHTPEDAYLYLTELKSILSYIEVSDCNMEEGSLRCDANISIRPKGQKELGTKAEVKNMNSFKGVAKALEYEIKRQKEVLSSGGKIVQETRLYDTDKDMTFSMRSKEEAHDYRYFPDPDLVPMIIDETYIDKIRNDLPELPREKKSRFAKEYGLTASDTQILCTDKTLAQYFEDAVKSYPKQPKKIANWIQSEVMRVLNEQNKSITEFSIPPSDIGEIFKLIDKNTITSKIAKQVFAYMLESGKSPSIIVREKGLEQVSDTGEIESIVDKIIEQNQQQVDQYKSGKTNLLGFFVGQVMKQTEGKANPQVVNELLKKKLD